jgi:protein-tyrosine phosphatase
MSVEHRHVFILRSGHPEHTQILPNLLVGQYPALDDAEWLSTVHGVTAILSLQDDADLASKCLNLRDLGHSYRRHNLQFHRMPVPDCDPEAFATRLDDIVALLGELLRKGERVYLHCNAGMNRAPTVAIAYLHAEHGLSLQAARDFVKERRHCVPYMQLLQTRYGTP